jgi:hypothetical protein
VKETYVVEKAVMKLNSYILPTQPHLLPKENKPFICSVISLGLSSSKPAGRLEGA